jgi:hypothetical protein
MKLQILNMYSRQGAKILSLLTLSPFGSSRTNTPEASKANTASGISKKAAMLSLSSAEAFYADTSRT